MTPDTALWIWNAPARFRIAGTLVFLVYAAISLYHLRQTRFARIRLISEGLKFCGAVLLLLTLWQPEIHTRTARTENARIAVIIDETDSMLTPDVEVAGEPAPRSRWVEALQARPGWEALARSVRLDLIRLTHEEDAPVRETDLRVGLARAAAREDLSAVLLLSDGGHNAPGSPLPEALQLAERGVPVFAVEVGQTLRLPDLVLEPVAFPSYTLVNEALILPVRVSSSLPEDARSEITLFADGEPVARQDIEIPAGREGNATLRWVPRDEGTAALTVELAPHPLERFLENNQARADLEVRSTTIRVLLIDTWPRWEFRFLRNALQRDPGVEVTSLLLHPELGPGRGPGFLNEFPKNPEEWGAFDVIFLGDVGLGPNELDDTDARNIALLIREQAGGLVFLPGPRGGHLRLHGTELEALLPVEFDANLPRGVGEELEMRFALTREGRDHMLTQLHPNPLRNQQIWRNLPGFFWYAGVTRARVGSDVLATHASHRNDSGRLPLLATRNAGTGHVLFLGTDGAWRWRRGVEDLYHYRFWGQVVRWMAHRRHMFGGEGSRLFLQPERPAAGQPGRVTLVLRGAAGSGEIPVRLRITDPDGVVVHPRLQALEGGGAFSAEWTPSRPGDHRLELVAAEDPSQVSLDQSVRVESRIVERIGDPMRPRPLRELAGVSGGQSVSMDDADALLARLQDLPRQQVVVSVRRIWQHPLWLIGVLTFFGLYWILRKQQGWV